LYAQQKFKSLKLWDLMGNCLQTFVGHTNIGIVFSANFSPDGKQIISTSGDNNLKLWDLAVCRQLPVKSQSLRLLSTEAETICLPSGLKFTLTTPAVCPSLKFYQ
jgi:WD40 repeat protein